MAKSPTFRAPYPSTTWYTTMPRKRSARTAEIENLVEKAIEAFKSGNAKTIHAAVKHVGLKS